MAGCPGRASGIGLQTLSQGKDRSLRQGNKQEAGRPGQERGSCEDLGQPGTVGAAGRCRPWRRDPGSELNPQAAMHTFWASK